MSVSFKDNDIAQSFSQNIYLDEVQKNDYFELYVYPIGTNEDVTVQNLNWMIDSR